MSDHEWMEQAACRNFPTALFFPAEHDDDETDGDNTIAKGICESCPVQEPCREYQMGEAYGVRGALTAEERGYGSRGRLGKNAVRGLSTTVSDIIRSHPDTEFTTDSMNSAIYTETGRRWPRNSVNAALLRLHQRGVTTRRTTPDQILAYRLDKDTV